MLNSLNKHDKNCMVDSKDNYKFDLGLKGLKINEDENDSRVNCCNL